MKQKFFILIAIFALLASCSSTKNVAYLQEAETLPQEALSQAMAPVNPVIMPGDLIDIIVSGINLEAVKPFNRLDLMYQIGGSSFNSSASQTGNSPTYYLVDNDGNIDFPVLGKLHIGGMNKFQVVELLTDELHPKYLNDKPIIDIRFKNFKVSVIGEVKNPGIYTAVNERLTILEAIAMAGDLNITGERENVMLVRTNPDGSKIVQRINMKDKNLILSPYYNLQQNDFIYVQPNASRARQSWSIPPAVSLILSSVGTLISLTTLIVTLSK